MVCVSTDGSFVHNPERCGFGVHVEKDGKTLMDLSGYTTAGEYLKSWNISSELIGAIIGVSWAAQAGYKEVTLYHDYNGIEHFVTGYFKPRTAISKKYVAIMKVLQETMGVTVNFVKVKGHSGHRTNEIADGLAGRYAEDRTEWVNMLLEKLVRYSAVGQQ